MVHGGKCPRIVTHLWIEVSAQRTVHVILIPPFPEYGRSKSWKSVHKGLWGKRLGKLRNVSFVKVAARLDYRNCRMRTATAVGIANQSFFFY